MPVEITMPQQSDTMTEGTVVKWRKKEGDKIAAGETIAEIETDKATMEQEAYDSGTLAAIVVPEGQKVKVGDLIAVLAGAGEKLEDIRKQFGGAKQKSGAAGGSQSAPAGSQAGAVALAEPPEAPGHPAPARTPAASATA